MAAVVDMSCVTGDERSIVRPMYTFDELREKYSGEPRRMDAYLRKMTYTETGDSLPFPFLKLGLATALFVGGTYWTALQFDFNLSIAAMLSLAIYMGVAIQIIRSASITERNARLLQKAPLVLARVVNGDSHLYQEGAEAGRAVVVFSLASRHNDGYLRGVAKRLRASVAQANGDPDLVAVAAVIDNTAGRALKLPAGIAEDDDTWLGVVDVNPDRLPDNKIVNQSMLLLVAPGDNLVAQL